MIFSFFRQFKRSGKVHFLNVSAAYSSAGILFRGYVEILTEKVKTAAAVETAAAVVTVAAVLVSSNM